MGARKHYIEKNGDVLSRKNKAKYLLKHRLLFQYDPIFRNPERISSIRLKTTNQRFGLNFKREREDHKRVVDIKRETRLAMLKGKVLEEEEIVIPLIHVSFHKVAYAMHSEDMTDVHA
jgi:hypothetical protein